MLEDEAGSIFSNSGGGDSILSPNYTGSESQEPYISPNYDPDSFSNRFMRSLNESQKSMYQGVGVVSRAIGSRGLEKWAHIGELEQDDDIALYGQSQRSSSLTEGLDEIGEADGIGEALVRAGTLLKDMTADALGSAGLPIAAGLAAIPVAAVTGPTVGAAALIAAPFMVGGSMMAGSTYSEAVKLGATEEEANRYALASGVVGGLLDRIGAAAIMKGLISQFGKDTVVKEIGKGIGEDQAKGVVDRATKFSLDLAKGAGKAGTIEGITEGAQEAVQAAAAGTAAGIPIEEAIEGKRLIDAAALGFIAGGGIGGLSHIASKGMAKDLELQLMNVKTLEENMEKGLKAYDEGKAGLDYGHREQTRGYTPASPDSMRGTVSNLMARSTAQLAEMAKRSPTGAAVYNNLNGYYDNLSARVGTMSAGLEPLLTNLKVKFNPNPLGSPLDKKLNRQTKDILEGKVPEGEVTPETLENIAALRKFIGTVEKDADGKIIKVRSISEKTLRDVIRKDKDIRSLEAAKRKDLVTEEDYNSINSKLKNLRTEFKKLVDDDRERVKAEGEGAKRTSRTTILNSLTEKPEYKSLLNLKFVNPKSTGLYKMANDAGVGLTFLENYVPILHKTGLLINRKRKQVLIQRGWTDTQVEDFHNRVDKTDGTLMDDVDEITVDTPIEEGELESRKTDREKRRVLSKEDHAALDAAGLIEDNLINLLTKYTYDLARRIEGKELAANLNRDLTALKRDGKANTAEIQRVKDIYNATQHNYNPIKSPELNKIMKWVHTSMYIFTLPLAGLTALSEPLIILSRVDPKYAAFGAVDATYNAMREGLRKFLPQLKLTEKEQAFRSIMQGFDPVLADRMGDISGVTVARKWTNRFFRATLLTSITQISRDIAFQAARAQMKDDLTKIQLHEAAGSVKDKGYVQAKKRLIEQGLTTRTIDSLGADKEILFKWADPKEDVKFDPEIVRKAMSKTVDEVIMAPNAVNRPLWMSNPHLALVSQLKGFMFTFGNTVGTRLISEVLMPLFKAQRIPVGEAAKYATSFALIMGASLFIQGLKDTIRYGDEESPFDKLNGKDKLFEALKRSNIMGSMTLLNDAAGANRYGSTALSTILGPAAGMLEGGFSNVGGYIAGNPRSLARGITSLVPFLRNIPMARDIRSDLVDAIEDLLEDIYSILD